MEWEVYLVSWLRETQLKEKKGTQHTFWDHKRIKTNAPFMSNNYYQNIWQWNMHIINRNIRIYHGNDEQIWSITLESSIQVLICKYDCLLDLGSVGSNFAVSAIDWLTQWS